MVGREVGMLEKVHHVRLENPDSLWENLEETPPTKLIRDILMGKGGYQAEALLNGSMMNVSYW